MNEEPSLDCIYCEKPNGPFTGEAHIFPEGLVSNRLALPPGFICDPCNSYFGANLEGALLLFPFFPLAIQFLGLPGKHRKARPRIGNVTRATDGWISIPIEKPKKSIGKGFTVTRKIDKTFRMPKFSRALHHIAFNILAAQTSHRFVLGDHLHPIRRYIRKPNTKDQFMPFVSIVDDLQTIRPEIAGGRTREAPGETIGIRIFNFDFYIDLLNRGGLFPWAQQTCGESVQFIDSNVQPPRREESAEHLYRIRMEPPRASVDEPQD